MGRAKVHCAYCDKFFEDSQDARKRHFSGRTHRANVKQWYAAFEELGSARAVSSRTPSGQQAANEWQQLPPSMVPAPPDAFRHSRRLAEWG